MTALDLTQLAADCEARAKAGEKPNPKIWGGYDVVIVPRSSDSDLGVFVLLGDEAEAVCREHDWQDDDPAAQLFAEALLAEATAPLHADKAVLMQTIRERDRMIGEMDERTRVCDTEQGRRIVEQLARIAALEARLAGMVSVEVVAELVTIAKDALVEAEKKLDSAARNYNAHAHNKNWRDGLSQRVKEADAKCVSIVNALARAEAEAATNAAKEKHDG